MPILKLETGVQLKVPEGLSRAQMDEVVEDYYSQQGNIPKDTPQEQAPESKLTVGKLLEEYRTGEEVTTPLGQSYRSGGLTLGEVGDALKNTAQKLSQGFSDVSDNDVEDTLGAAWDLAGDFLNAMATMSVVGVKGTGVAIGGSLGLTDENAGDYVRKYLDGIEFGDGSKASKDLQKLIMALPEEVELFAESVGNAINEDFKSPAAATISQLLIEGAAGWAGGKGATTAAKKVGKEVDKVGGKALGQTEKIMDNLSKRVKDEPELKEVPRDTNVENNIFPEGTEGTVSNTYYYEGNPNIPAIKLNADGTNQAAVDARNAARKAAKKEYETFKAEIVTTYMQQKGIGRKKDLTESDKSAIQKRVQEQLAVNKRKNVERMADMERNAATWVMGDKSKKPENFTSAVKHSEARRKQAQMELEAKRNLPLSTRFNQVIHSALGKAIDKVDVVNSTFAGLNALDYRLFRMHSRWEGNLHNLKIDRRARAEEFFSTMQAIRDKDRGLAAQIDDALTSSGMVVDSAYNKQLAAHKMATSGIIDLAEATRIIDDVYKLRNEIGAEAKVTGMRGQDIMGLPRKIRDDKFEALMQDLNLEQSMQKSLKDLYEAYNTNKLTDIEFNTKANNILLGGAHPQVNRRPTSGHEKSRTIADETYRNKHDHYEPTEVALMDYIDTMTDAVETRKYMGVDDTVIQAAIDKGMIKGDPTDIDIYNAGIGGYITKLQKSGIDLNDDQLRRLKDIMSTRFGVGRTAAGKAQQVVNSLGHLLTIADYSTALLQVVDALPALQHVNALNLARGIRDTIQKKGITARQVGDDILNTDFTDVASTKHGVAGKTKTITDLGIRASLLPKIVDFGKSNIVNANWHQIRRTVLDRGSKRFQKFEKEWKAAYTDTEWSNLLKDIEDGNLQSFEVRSMLFAKLADVQPITKSNIPLSKLRNPNMRWAWNLTSYMTQGWNNLGIEVRKAFQQGRIRDGYKKLFHVGVILQASAVSSQVQRDALKSLLFEGEVLPEQMDQSVVKAMLGYMFTSAYDLNHGDDYFSSVLKGRTPPALSIPYGIAQDIYNGEMNLHFIPVVGGMIQGYVKGRDKATEGTNFAGEELEDWADPEKFVDEE